MGVNALQIDDARVLERFLDSGFRNLVKHDALGFGDVDTERFCEMPGDGFALAVLIGREDDALGFGRFFFQKVHLLPGFGWDDVLRCEVILDINPELGTRQIADVAIGGLHDKILSEESADRSRLCGTFDDNE